MGKFYKPTFEKQATGSDLEWFNCGAASGAMLADQATLGIKDPTPDRFRKKTGDKSGGLHMSAIGNGLEAFGIDAIVFDNDDRLKFPKLVQRVQLGQHAVIAGDYEVLPPELRGDKDYEGNHSVFLWRVFQNECVIGDPLNDGRRPNIPKGWIRWPNEVLYDYVKRFDQQVTGGIHACFMRRSFVKPRSQVMEAKIRLEPEKFAPVIGTLTYGKRLVTGGTIVGEVILGQERWFKVWYPPAGIGYIHTSMAYRA
jgi:hypothetical protein